LDQIIRTAFKDAIRVYLDSKESEILKRINEDKMTNRKIGEEVYYTENTVKNTLRQLFNLTGIHDRSQLASWYAHYIAPICESD